MTETTRTIQRSSQSKSREEDTKHIQGNVPSFATCSSDVNGDTASSCKEILSETNINGEPVVPRLQVNNDPGKTVEEMQYSEQASYMKMQSAMAAQDAFMRAGGYDMRAYYGWLPGIAPVRFPAFIYPSPFFGFAPNVAVAKKNENDLSPRTGTGDQWDSNKADTTSEKMRATSEFVHDNPCVPLQTKFAADFVKSDVGGLAYHKDIASDEDEGLVLEEGDSKRLRRRRQTEHESGQSQRRVATVSVIQENSTFQKPNESAQNTKPSDCTKAGEAVRETCKRGRASTRQIEKTDQYWDRRKKNNLSAKKSRDARRQREIMTNQRSAMLEAENLRLRAELATVRDENERLKKELNNIKSA